MNENIDLTKILDGCPEGTKFYCDIIDKEVEFYGINLPWMEECIAFRSKEGFSIVDCDTHQYFICVNKYGSICWGCKNTVVFPSKDQRDWSKFERFWDKPKVEKFDPKTLQPFDKTLVRDANDREWFALMFSHINAKGKVIAGGCSWIQVIPYNEDTKHLVGTTNDCPEYYKWWEK